MIRTVLLAVPMAAMLLAGCKSQDDVQPAEVLSFVAPAHFPTPTYDFSQNPVIPAGFELGRMLFYDPALSRDGTISCGFCHIQSSSFTQHNHALSHGIDGLLTIRNSQPIQNLAWSKSLGWDGGIDQLDLFAPSPIQNPHEMGDNLANVLAKLKRRAGYKPLFAKAFGDTAITTARFLKALSQFQLMCISANSRYDKILTNQPGYSLTPAELAGKQVFEAKCSRCHSGVLFTDDAFHSNGLPIRNRADTGRAHVTARAEDRYRFRTPSLRNVMLTGPYMHDGRFLNLKGVLDHYSSGVVDEGYTDAELAANRGIALSEDDKANLVAFFKTLTDTSFVTNLRLSVPNQLP